VPSVRKPSSHYLFHFICAPLPLGANGNKPVDMSPSVIGAPLGAADLETWGSPVLQENRDLELQAFHTTAVLDGNWNAEESHTAKRISAWNMP